MKDSYICFLPASCLLSSVIPWQNEMTGRLLISSSATHSQSFVHPQFSLTVIGSSGTLLEHSLNTETKTRLTSRT